MTWQWLCRIDYPDILAHAGSRRRRLAAPPLRAQALIPRSTPAARTVMSPQIFSLSLAGFFGLLLLAAAYKGHRMPLPLILALVLVGASVVVAPTAFSFFLQMVGRQPRFSDDEQITCWILGGVMVLVGMLAGIVPTRRPRDRSAP